MNTGGKILMKQGNEREREKNEPYIYIYIQDVPNESLAVFVLVILSGMLRFMPSALRLLH
jgi:hypothetical protein